MANLPEDVRNSVKKVLGSDYDQYEKKLWNMCNRLSKKYDDEIGNLYKVILYEKMGQLLSGDKDLQERIFKDIKEDIVLWESCVYDNYRKSQEKYTTQIIEGIKVEKGAFTCRNKKCKSEECFTWQVQIRSIDEPATTFVRCSICNTQYKFG